MKVKVTPPLSGANLAACAWLAGLLFGLLEWAHLEQLAHSTPSPIYSTPLLGATTVGVAMLVATAVPKRTFKLAPLCVLRQNLQAPLCVNLS